MVQTVQSLFVGGFVDIKSYPATDKCLLLDHERLGRVLPIKKPLPINIEHLADAEVGWIYGIYPVNHGLFCVGKIHSQAFLNIVSQVSLESHAAKIKLSDTMPDEPILQTLHAWLPELSLSSVAPDLISCTPDSEIFHHVALCALGKRRGVVAVYGNSVDWILSKFNSLSSSDRSNISAMVTSAMSDQDLHLLPSLNFSSSLDTLLAKAIDAGFIKNRLDLLKTDRHAAAVKESTYLKASHLPDSQRDHTLATQPEPQSMSTSTQQSDDSGMITVPKSALVSLLTKADTLSSTQGQGAQFYNHPSMFPFGNNLLNMPTHPLYYQPSISQQPYHQASTNPWILRNCGATMPPQFTTQGLPMHPPYPPTIQYVDDHRPAKRKREPEDSDDHALFPGEGEKRGLYSELLSMAGTIAALKSEVSSLKQTIVPTSQPYMQHMQFPQPLQSMTGDNENRCITQTLQQVPHMSHQLQPPASQATQNVPHDQGSSVVSPVPPAVCHGQTAPAEEATVHKRPGKGRIDASNNPAPRSKVQQLFCDELSKQ